MLTRRGFAGIATCALCSVSGFVATDASAQTSPPATTPGVTRKILSQIDGPTPGYVTLIVDIEIEPGVTIGRHTHPGVESAYMLDGGFDLPIEGQPTKSFKPGDAVVIPANTPHAGGKTARRNPTSSAPISSRRASRSPRRRELTRAVGFFVMPGQRREARLRARRTGCLCLSIVKPGRGCQAPQARA